MTPCSVKASPHCVMGHQDQDQGLPCRRWFAESHQIMFLQTVVVFTQIAVRGWLLRRGECCNVVTSASVPALVSPPPGARLTTLRAVKGWQSWSCTFAPGAGHSSSNKSGYLEPNSNSSIETLSLVFLNFDINTVTCDEYRIFRDVIINYVSLLTTPTPLLEGFVA